MAEKLFSELIVLIFVYTAIEYDVYMFTITLS